MTQRQAPPPTHAALEDDEDEERTSVGAAPDPEPGRPFAMSPPLPLAPQAPSPPSIPFGKFNTPTAFTPHQGHPAPNVNGGGANGSGGPPAGSAPPQPPRPMPAHAPQATHPLGLHHVDPRLDPRSSAAMTAARAAGPTVAPPDSGPVSSGAHRSSSGPQPIMAQPMLHTPQGFPASGAQSGLMPFASQHPPQPQQPQQPQQGLAISGPMSALAGPIGSPLGVRTDQQLARDPREHAPRENRAAAFHITRTRAYSFVLDARNQPIELGSGRFAKAYLGEERWLESKTDFRKPIVIKILQKGVSEEDHMRFQMEMELLERVQGQPEHRRADVASGEERGSSNILPPSSIRDKCRDRVYDPREARYEPRGAPEGVTLTRGAEGRSPRSPTCASASSACSTT